MASNPRPPSPLERRLGVTTPESWRHEAPPAWKQAAVDNAAADGEAHDDTGNKTVDMSMWDASKSNLPGQPPRVNPLSVLQQQMLRIQAQVASVVQRFPMIEQSMQQMQQQVQQLVQQGQMSGEQGAAMQQQMQGLWAELQGQQQPQPDPNQQPQPDPNQPGSTPPPAGMGAPPPDQGLDNGQGQPQQPGDQPAEAAAPGQPFSDQADPYGPEAGGLMAPGSDRKIQKPNRGQPKQPPYAEGVEAMPPQRVETAIKNAAASDNLELQSTPEDEQPAYEGGHDPGQMLQSGHHGVPEHGQEEEPSVSAYELMQLLDETYGHEWAGWEFETLIQTLSHDLETTPDERIQAMIGALQVLRGNPNGFWQDHDIFEDTLLGLNGVTPNFGGPDDVSPGQLVYGVNVAQDIAPAIGDPGMDVQTYVAVRLLENGMLIAIHPLEWAQGELVQEAGRRGIDTSIDLAQVQQRFVELIHTPIEEAPLSPSDPVDQQVQAMLVVRDYMNHMEPMPAHDAPAGEPQEDDDGFGDDALRLGHRGTE